MLEENTEREGGPRRRQEGEVITHTSSKEQVQAWFQDKFPEHASKFSKLPAAMILKLTLDQIQKEIPGLEGAAIYNELHPQDSFGTETTDTASRFFLAIQKFYPNYPPFSKRITKGLNALYSGLDISHQSKKNLERMINTARHYLSSTTVQGIQTRTTYIIDGFITSNGKSSIYNIFKNTHPFSGKIMEKYLFDHEVKMMTAVGNCKWIVYMVDSFQIGDDLWTIVMPAYIKTLSEIMQIWHTSTSYTPDEQAIVNVFFSLLKALKHLSHLRIAHCDIKADNIMVDSNGHVVLIDFGASSFYGDKVFEYTAKESLDVIETDKHVNFQIAGLPIDLLCTATTMVKIGSGKIGPKKLVGFRTKVREHLKAESSICYQFANLCLEALSTNSSDTSCVETIWMKASEIVTGFQLPSQWSD